MHWFWIALIAPALWGVTNYIDKYLLSRYFKGGNTGTLIIFSALVGFFVLPIAWLIEPAVFSISSRNLFLILTSGLLFSLYLFPYFYALSKDEASVVIPIFQIIPIFSFILAYFFLGEVLSIKQIVAGLIIILGAIGLSLEIREKTRFKKEVFGAMILASALISVAFLLFKYVAVEESFWMATFWENVALFCVGMFLIVFIRPYRQQFFRILKETKNIFLGINVVNEVVGTIAGLTFTFASLLAPIALVQIVNGFQPFFVLLYGILLTKIAPSLVKEDISKKALAQKIVFIILIFLGTYLLLSQ